jgi:phage tail sheath gpL-like
MTVSTGIPSNWNIPLFWATVDGSMAGNASSPQTALLVGQYFGAATAGTPIVGTPVLTGAGGGSCTLLDGGSLPYGTGVQAGNYRAICINAGSPATFEVLRPDGTIDGFAATGTAYTGQLNFTIASAGASYAIGSTWTITVTLPATSIGGGAIPNVPIAVGSPQQAAALFGYGSMLERMFNRFFACNVNQNVWALPLPDASGGVAATGAVVFSGSTLSSGVVTIYIAGQVVDFSIASTDTPTSVGGYLATAINAMATLPVTAVNTAGSVALTCRWKGATGNDITIIPNYRGFNNGEVTPVGLTITVTAMSGGATNPTMTTAIAAIQPTEFDYVALPYTDAGSLAAWATEYGFQSGGRWNYSRQQYGMVLGAYRNDYSDAINWGLLQNAPVISTMYVEQGAPSPIWEWTAAYCALAALGFSADPARPLQTLEMIGLLPAPVNQRMSAAQLNNLTNSGFAIQSTAPDGNPMILREQSQYQLNQYGQSDTAFGLLTVLATLQALLQQMKSAITSKYPRMNLIPNGTRIGPGQAAVTPDDIKAELISEFLLAQWNGLVDDLTDFENNLIVQISDTNPNVITVLWPPQLAGQLRSFQLLAQFRLLYPPITLT